MNDELRREMVGLLSRIVGDKPLPADLQRTALELFTRLATPELAPSEPSAASGAAVSSAGPLVEEFGSVAAVGAAVSAAPAAVGNRRLIYVHGICRHDKGFSDDWWTALKPFVTAFGAGQLGDTRLEVVWSDLVNQSATALASATLGGASFGAAVAEDERARMAAAIRETLRDREDRQRQAVALAEVAAQGSALGGAVGGIGLSENPLPIIETPSGNAAEMVTGASGSSGSSMSCLDDFSVYLVHDPTRQAVIDRFTAVVRAEIQAGHEVDIISHSWGTVVAYEGLRELEDAGVTTKAVRNLFTVGSALSIGAVKLGLRSTNKDGRRPANVRRWINLDAVGDLVGGQLQGRPYAVDKDFVNLAPFGCGHFLTLVNPVCAHSSYFQSGNTAVNRDIFGKFINS